MKKLIFIFLSIVALSSCSDLDLVPKIEAQVEGRYDNVDTIYIFTSGQSNCITRCGGTGGVIVTSDSVRNWSPNNLWVHAIAGSGGFGADKGDYALTFAQKLFEEYRKPVGILKKCYGGNPIENWLPPINTNMDGIEFEVADAGVQRIDIFLFLQGEANANNAAGSLCDNDACYRTKRDSLITVLRTKSWFGANGLFISGQLHNGVYGDRNGVIAELNDDYTDGDASGILSSPTSCDGVHLTGETQNTLGISMYDAFIGLANGSPPVITPSQQGNKVIYINSKIRM